MPSVPQNGQRFAKPARRSPSTLVDLLRLRAAGAEGVAAYTFLAEGDAEQTALTFRELDLRARAVAARLQSEGLGGERVLLLYQPGLEYVVGFFGCLYAGAVAVPAYPPRANQNLQRLQTVVEDCRAAAALTTSQMVGRLQQLCAHIPGLKELRWLASDEVADERAQDWQRPGVGADTLAFLQYTSGSTSAPKGVMVSHGNLLHNQSLIREAFGQSEESVIVGWLPLYHDMGLIGNVLQPLYLGARCVLMSPAAFLQRPARWLEAISAHRATTSGGPNFAYELCVEKVTQEQSSGLDLSSWGVAFNGAEPVRAETLERFASRFAPCGFRREALRPCYGLAEATLLVSGSRDADGALVKRLRSKALENGRVEEAADGDEAVRVLSGCGAPSDGQSVVVVNPESLTPCASDEVGELWVAGPSVALGYWGRAEETEGSFRARLAGGGGPFLRTGDLGFLRHGELFVTGRRKDLIIIRGLNHYPQDIELTAERSHTALRPGGGAAFSVEAGGDERLVVVHEVRRGSRHEADEVAECVRRAVLAEHEVEPFSVVLIKQASLPRTSSGKVRRGACRAMFLEGTLDAVGRWQAAAAHEPTPPPTPPTHALRSAQEIEAWLVSELAARLRVSAGEIDVSQPITSYGLDSLTAIELMHGIEVTLGISLPMVSFLQSPSIAELAAQAVVQLGAASSPSIAPASALMTDHSLSFGQRSLWFLHQLAPESPVYNITRAMRVRAELDVAALRRAFQSLVDRHPALRTTFPAPLGEPVQRTREQAEVYFEHEEASAWDDETLVRRLSEKGRQPFDLENGPVLRVGLFTRSAREHFLLVSVHHIVADFWSLAVLTHELGVLYAAEKAGVPANLPPHKLRYTDHVCWQAGALSGPFGEKLRDYWLKQLGGELPVLNLPTDRTRPPVQTYRGDSLAFRIDEGLTRELKALGRAHGATLHMTLLAAFQVLLHRYTGQDDILVGSPTAGRGWADLAGVVGYFVNPVVLRADFSARPTFLEFLAQVRRTVLSAFEHQDYPLALLVEQLQPVRDPSRSPLIQVMFALQKAHLLNEQGLAPFALGEPGARLTLGELELESLALEQGVSQFDLTLMMAETGGGLSGSFEYNTDIFEAATVARLAEHFKVLLAGIVAAPSREAARMPLLTEPERRQLLDEWNDTSAPRAEGVCVHQLIEAQAARTPDAVAAVCGGERMTYGELNGRADLLARRLRSLGVGPEELVCVCMERSPAMLVALLGVIKAGGAYVPLDPSSPAHRLGYMVEDSRARLLLTERKLSEAFHNKVEHVICLDDGPEAFAGECSAGPCAGALSDNLAYVIYTSGSTGRPKGVEVQHRSLMNLVEWHLRAYSVSPSDRATQLAGTGFDAAVWEVWPYLVAGASIHFPDEETRLSAVKLRDWLVAGRITITFLPTPLAEAALSAEWPPHPDLKFLLTGGDRLSVYPPPSLGFTLVNHYGPTEATVVTTCATVAPAEGADAPPPIGRPIENVEVYLLDGQMQPVAVGIAGELYVGGGCLARGYLNRPDLTAERFVPDPFSEKQGARLYRTGDLARYLPGGEIEYLGRLDHQVKVRGFRVELGEIEAALGGHAAVGEVVVAARTDGGGQTRLVAYLSPAEAPADEDAPVMAALAASELRRYLRERLPEYMVPSAFVCMGQLPLTPNGKVDLRALPAWEEAEGPGGVYAGPKTPTEEVLSGIYASVLGLERVGVTDNFFDIGGHSLLAAQIISRVRESFKVELPLRKIFEEPTIEGLAPHIDAAVREGIGLQVPPLAPAPREGELPLSFAQQRLWFLDQLEPGSAFYNVPAAIRVRGHLDERSLERSIDEVARRHEVLRTGFARVEGRPVPFVSEARPLAISRFDLRQLPESEREAECSRLVADEARRPFDLSRGQLLRVTLIRLAEAESVLAVTMHHISCDGWSTEVFVRELAALYAAFSRGKASPLPELPFQYADYAHWQRQWLTGEFLESQLSYWRRQLAGAPPALELPTDRPRPAVQTFRGASESAVLPESLCEALRELSRREGVTPFMTLLAAFAALLGRHTGQTDIVVGTPTANRGWVEVEKLIGFFVNTLALRTDLSGAPTFRQLLGRVRETALGAYTHQDVPFEKLVEELRPERELSRSPLFQVLFALQSPPSEALRLEGLELELLRPEGETAKFDLTLTVEDGPREMVCSMEYNTDLFDRETVARMLGHLRALLEGATQNPDASVEDLNLLTEAERRQLLSEWNDTAREYPRGARLHDLVARQAALTPDSVAVEFGGERLTYRQLNERANGVARYLRERGVGPEALVGVMLERGPRMIVALLGVLKAGGAYVPLDPAYPRERLAFMLEDTRAPVLIAQERFLDALPAHAAEVVCVDRDWPAVERLCGEVAADHEARPANLAYVIYTSGSTGRPKGVAITHHSAVTFVHWSREIFAPSELAGVLASTSICFDLSVFEIFVTLSCGGTVILAENALRLPAPGDSAPVTLVNTVPSAMSELLRLGALPESARTVNLAGEALPRKLVEDLYSRAHVERVFNLYGPSEDTTYSTYTLLERGGGQPSIGRPVANTQAYVLDRRMRPVPVGVAGEVYLAGDGLARGYLNRPAQTAERFVPDPFSAEPGGRLYRTGDLARYLPGGEIEYLGRLDHQVKVRGFRIELGEIEAALGGHAGVREVVVTAREVEGGEKRIVAYLVAEEPAPSAAELRTHLKRLVPEYMVPSAFVTLEEMPLTPNGKVDRKRLPAPEQARAEEAGEDYVPARNETEAAVAAIWQRVLGVQRVGVFDNFFEIGGHSLLATQVLAKVCDAFAVELPLRAVFESPTVAQLSEAVERARAAEVRAPAILPYSREQYRRPAPGLGKLVAAEIVRERQT